MSSQENTEKETAETKKPKTNKSKANKRKKRKKKSKGKGNFIGVAEMDKYNLKKFQEVSEVMKQHNVPESQARDILRQKNLEQLAELSKNKPPKKNPKDKELSRVKNPGLYVQIVSGGGGPGTKKRS